MNEAAHHGAVDGMRVGRAVRSLRQSHEWRQSDLAARAGTTQTTVSRLERGRLDRLLIGAVKRVVDALEADLVLDVRWHGEGLARLLDEAHSALVEDVLGRLDGFGWLTAPEVSYSSWGERGSVDVLAFHPATRVCLVVEVKSVVPDVQAMLTALDRKQRLGREIAKGRAWDPVAVGRLLVIADGRTSRRRVAEHERTFEVAFPLRGVELRRWLRAPGGATPLADATPSSAAMLGSGAPSGLWFLAEARVGTTRGR